MISEKTRRREMEIEIDGERSGILKLFRQAELIDTRDENTVQIIDP
jgi:hypothetical protein